MTLDEFDTWALEHPDADELVLTPAEAVQLTNDLLDRESAEPHFVDERFPPNAGVGVQRVRRRGDVRKRSVRVVVRPEVSRQT
jgi:hypothetical protein